MNSSTDTYCNDMSWEDLLVKEEGPIRVSILKCDNPFSWYNEKVGYSYEVYETSTGYHLVNGIGTISKDDADCVIKLRNKKIKTIIC